MTSPSKHPEIYAFLLRRRSASLLIEPQPDRAELRKILEVAATVPDHGGLQPYRFVVVQGAARDAMGEALVNAAEEGKGQPLDGQVKPKIKAKAFAAPLQILIIYSPVLGTKVPLHEQMAAASCTGYAVVLATQALGFGAVWKSFAYDPGTAMQKLLRLESQEKLLGWINIGTEKARDMAEREPLDVATKVMFLD